MRVLKKYVGVLILLLLFTSIAVIPAATAKKSNPDHITFVKLSDIEFIDKSGQGISMTKGWLKDLLKVEWGYGSYTNATLVWDGEKLTVYLQDDSKHDGRWFALNEKILQKVGIDPDKVSVKLDTQAPAEVVKRLKADGKWFYFFIDHFTTRYVTFEASEGYVEYSDWGWQKYTKLIEPESAPYEGFWFYADAENTTAYFKGSSISASGSAGSVSGYLGNAWSFTKGQQFSFDVPDTEIGGVTIIARTKMVSANYTSSQWLDVVRVNHPSGAIRLEWVIDSGSNTVRLQVTFSNGTSTSGTGNTPLETGKWYIAVAKVDFSTDTIAIKVYDENFSIAFEDTRSYDLVEHATVTTINVGELTGLDGTLYYVDEVTVLPYVVSDEEEQVLVHFPRAKLSLWQGNETSLPGYLNATLFCPLDELDTVNKVTPCYLNKSLVNATVYFNESTGYPKLVSGFVKNGVKFDGNDGEYIKLPFDIVPNTLTSVSVAFVVKDTTAGTTHESSDKYIGEGSTHLEVDYTNIKKLQGVVMFSDGTFDSVGGEYDLTDDEWHVIAYNLVYDPIMNITTAQLVVDGQLLVEEQWNKKAYFFTRTSTSITVGGNTVKDTDAVIDEVYIRANSTFTPEETELLLHLSRHKTAVLSAPSATFDGSQFLVNVTAQLPNDGGSYILPAPLGAQGLTAIGQIGNFAFLNTGTAGEVSYTLPVSEDLSCPAGINLLAWLYNNEIYMTGAEDQFPVMATIMHLPKGVWYTTHGEIVYQQITTTQTTLVIANVTSPASLVTRYPNLFINPQNNYVNVTEVQKSSTLVRLNVSAPSGEEVVFTIGGLFPKHNYRLYVDGEEIDTIETSESGYLSFKWSDWSTHLITVEAYTPGEEWFEDTIDIVEAIMVVAVFVPIFGFAYLLSMLYNILLQQRTSGREEVPVEVMEGIVSFGKLLLVIGIIAVMFLFVAMALIEVL